jgi:serpin B
MFRYRKNILTVMLLTLLTAVISINLTGCTIISAKDLTAGVKKETTAASAPDEEFSLAGNIFAVELFKATAGQQKTKGNAGSILLSPVSAWLTLSSAALGAKGDTLTEMEQVLGNGMDIEKLCRYLMIYSEEEPAKVPSKMEIANSIWINDRSGFKADDSYLKKCVTYFDSQVYRTHFDSRAVSDMNNWVNKNTGGKIKKLIGSLPGADAAMLLINSLSFDAEWVNIYDFKDVTKDTFYNYSGSTRSVDFMLYQYENYIRDTEAHGILKYYKSYNTSDRTSGRQYAFAALLPDEGIDVFDYISGLTGERLREAVFGKEWLSSIKAYLPKFKFNYSASLKDQLMSMGMKKAFDQSDADFSGLGTSPNGNLFIYGVEQKTVIEVDERGTRAGAASYAGLQTGGLPAPEEIRFNRPFVFAIFDTETQIPVFIGAVTEL